MLELASDERVQELLLEEEASQPSLAPTMRTLLFNHACTCLAEESYSRAAPFFAAALPLCADDGQRLECLRAGALCALAVGQYERALGCLDAADQLVPGQVASTLLRLKVLLRAGREGEAAQAVRGLLLCSDTEPDVLRVACCEAQSAGMPGAARAALTALLEHLAADPDAAQSHPPGYEATIWQNLVALVAESFTAVQQQPGSSPRTASPRAAGSSQNGHGIDEQAREGVGEGGSLPNGLAGSALEEAARVRARDLASTIDGAVCRMRTVGAPIFFGQLEKDSCCSQQQWFSLTAWNAALTAARAGHLQPAAALLACAGDLLAAMPHPDAASLQRCRTAYAMAAAATADVLAATSEEQVGVGHAAKSPGRACASCCLKREPVV